MADKQWRIKVTLQGAGDHEFVSVNTYPAEGPANVNEFAVYIQENYPEAHVEVISAYFTVVAVPKQL